jgi:AcrR family transcriptional regulator
MQSELENGLRRRGAQARGRATRLRLLDAAEHLFTRKGYDGTSMGDVAGRAGVGVGTLYHHFSDKRSVLLELIERWGDRIATQRRGDLDFAAFLGDEPRLAVERWLHKVYARLRDRPSLYLIVLGMAGRDEEVRRRYQRIEQIAIERLTALIEFGQRRGLFRERLEPESAAFLIHHSLDMAMAQLLLREHGVQPDRVLAELTDLICRYAMDETASALRGDAMEEDER